MTRTSRNIRLAHHHLSSSFPSPSTSAVLSTAGVHIFQNFVSPVTDYFSVDIAAAGD